MPDSHSSSEHHPDAMPTANADNSIHPDSDASHQDSMTSVKEETARKPKNADSTTQSATDNDSNKSTDIYQSVTRSDKQTDQNDSGKSGFPHADIDSNAFTIECATVSDGKEDENTLGLNPIDSDLLSDSVLPLLGDDEKTRAVVQADSDLLSDSALSQLVDAEKTRAVDQLDADSLNDTGLPGAGNAEKEISLAATEIFDTLPSDSNLPSVPAVETPAPNGNPPPVLSPISPQNDEQSNAFIRATQELDESKTNICLESATETLPFGLCVDDKYEVKDVVGIGGFATVYRAIRVADHREIAMKVMDVKRCDDPSYTQRFLQEAKIAAQIHHKNVAEFYDYGCVKKTNQPYIAMELIHGHDLSHELTQTGALSPKRAFNLLRPVVEALAVGHKLGIVHKDLKPDNFYISEPGTPNECIKILDFGIARVEGEKFRLTADGQILGTPRYLAPEYISYHLVTPAIDVYQMALIFSEVLTQVPVVTGDPYQSMMLHCAGKLQIAKFLLKDKVGEVFRKALSIDPIKRYKDCQEFGEALDSIRNYFEYDKRLMSEVVLLSDVESQEKAVSKANPEAVQYAQTNDIHSKYLKIIFALAAIVLCCGAVIAYMALSGNLLASAPPADETEELCQMASKALKKDNFCEAYDFYRIAETKGILNHECKQKAAEILSQYEVQCKN